MPHSTKWTIYRKRSKICSQSHCCVSRWTLYRYIYLRLESSALPWNQVPVSCCWYPESHLTEFMDQNAFWHYQENSCNNLRKFKFFHGIVVIKMHRTLVWSIWTLEQSSVWSHVLQNSTNSSQIATQKKLHTKTIYLCIWCTRTPDESGIITKSASIHTHFNTVKLGVEQHKGIRPKKQKTALVYHDKCSQIGAGSMDCCYKHRQASLFSTQVHLLLL